MMCLTRTAADNCGPLLLIAPKRLADLASMQLVRPDEQLFPRSIADEGESSFSCFRALESAAWSRCVSCLQAPLASPRVVAEVLGVASPGTNRMERTADASAVA